jgi:hypothetical protein
VQKDDWRVICRARFGICHIQDAGIDLLQRGKRGIRSWLDRRQLRRSFIP